MRSIAATAVNCCSALLLFLFGPFAVSGFALEQQGSRPRQARPFGRLPLYFERNAGQAGPAFDFVSRGQGHGIYLNATQAVLVLRGAQSAGAGITKNATGKTARRADVEVRVIHMNLVGANAEARCSNDAAAAAKVNYLIGTDPAQWRRDLPTYDRVRYDEVYPGVDLVYYGRDEEIEHDFIIAPGANYHAIRWRFDGVSRLEISPEGEALLSSGSEEVRLQKPIAYQTVFGIREEVTAAFRLLDHRTVGFEVGEYDLTKPLVIDPLIRYSTYLGGQQDETGWAIAVDAAGNAYAVGETLSTGLPALGGYQGDFAGGRKYDGRRVGGDAFIAKLDPNGALQYLTYLGGNGIDVAFDVTIDAGGNAYLAGYTDSTNFPTRSAYQPNISGKPLPPLQLHPVDAFVAKLNPAGTDLVYSTYLGGTNVDVAVGIGVDSAGAAYVTGYTDSTNFIVQCICDCITNASFVVTNFSDPTNLCGTNSTDYHVVTNILGVEVFVARLSPAGDALEAYREFGGIGRERGLDLAVAANDNVVVAGFTESLDFPLSPAPVDTVRRGSMDAFVTKLDFTVPASPQIVFSTLISGSGDSTAYGVGVDGDGCIYVAGTKFGADFPGTGDALNAGGVFKSIDAGNSWDPASAGLLHPHVQALVADAANPANLYAGTLRGVFLSGNAAASWIPSTVNVGLAAAKAFAIDPATPSTIYAGTSGGVFKSTNGGVTWVAASTGLTSSDVSALAIPSAAPTNIYAGTRGGVFKSTNGALSWARMNSGLANQIVNALAIHPSANQIVYAATEGGVFKSTNAGTSWRAANTGLANKRVKALVIDPNQPLTLYAGTAKGLFKSLNGATNWNSSSGTVSNFFVNSMVIDPQTPSTLYAAATNGVFKSADAGLNWTTNNSGLTATNIAVLAIDPVSPTTLYAGARGTNSFGGSNDVFLVKLTPDGLSYVYALTFGGNGRDEAWDVAIDSFGNAYLTGTTTSTDLPVVAATNALPNPFVLDRTSVGQGKNSGRHDAYVAEFDAGGAALIYSVYLGGRAEDFGYGIAVDAACNAYVIGKTAKDRSRVSTNFSTFDVISNMPPVIVPVQQFFGSDRRAPGPGDAFITKLLPPDPCALMASAVTGGVMLLWPASASGFQLESSDQLGGLWVPVSAQPFMTNGQNCVFLPASGESRFFRLSGR